MSFLQDYLRFSAISSYLSTFVDGIGVYAKDDGFLHATLTQSVTATGRFSGKEPNMQNMPRGGTFPGNKPRSTHSLLYSGPQVMAEVRQRKHITYSLLLSTRE